jgi:hypothetical protein
VLLHSAANMLQNEMNVLQSNRRCAREGLSMGTFIGSRVKAALSSAGHRALRSVTLVLYRERGCQSPRLEPASSSPSMRGTAHEPATDGSHHRLQRKVCFTFSTDSDDLVMSEGGSVDRESIAVAVIARNRMLPLSGTS